jgi:hypothetical protein
MLVMNSEDAAGAWISIALPPGGGTHLHLTQPDGGPPVIDSVYVHGPQITASTLQAIPISHLAVAASMAESLFTVLTVLKYGGYRNPVTADVEGDEPSLAALRHQADGAPATLRLFEQIEREKLTRPDGTDPDGFAERVAAAYRQYVMETRSPALKIAEEAGVPVGTARGWIKEARRRGKLPQGHKGKAG